MSFFYYDPRGKWNIYTVRPRAQNNWYTNFIIFEFSPWWCLHTKGTQTRRTRCPESTNGQTWHMQRLLLRVQKMYYGAALDKKRPQVETCWLGELWILFRPLELLQRKEGSRTRFEFYHEWSMSIQSSIV